MKSFIAVICVLFLSAARTYDARADWDAGRDLKAVELTNGPLELMNPNPSVPAWSYGYRSTIEGAALTLFSNAAGQHTNGEVGYPGFDGWKRIDQNGPVLLVNAGSSPLNLDFGGGPLLPLPAGFIDMHPGVDNSVPVVRWTAPMTGTYGISAQWSDLDSFGGDGASADIVINGVSVFHDQWDNGGATSNARSVALTIGDTVDFVTGARSDYAYDTTAFNAVIAPEPSSIMLTALALLGLTFCRWKTSRLSSCRRVLSAIACAGAVSAMPRDLHADWTSAIAASQPLNWYTLDETTGTIAYDHGSEGLNGSYGADTNDPVRGRPGLVGTGVEFTGDTENMVANQNIFLGGSTLTGDWSAEFVVKKKASSYSQVLLEGVDSFSPSTALKLEQWPYLYEVGYTQFGIADYTFTPSAFVPFDQFVLLDYVNSAAGLQLYFDGVMAGSNDMPMALDRVRIGDDRGESLYGILDEVVLYDRALPPAEIAGHFAAVPEPPSIVLAVVSLIGVAFLRRKAVT
jgi:Concanavalin A-like lectin/glucanases superfamily